MACLCFGLGVTSLPRRRRNFRHARAALSPAAWRGRATGPGQQPGATVNAASPGGPRTGGTARPHFLSGGMGLHRRHPPAPSRGPPKTGLAPCISTRHPQIWRCSTKSMALPPVTGRGGRLTSEVSGRQPAGVPPASAWRADLPGVAHRLLYGRPDSRRKAQPQEERKQEPAPSWSRQQRNDVRRCRVLSPSGDTLDIRRQTIARLSGA